MTSIPDYFSGKNVLITGGGGFLGKVLIEKLLRSCPDIGNIYMLIRPKKGKQPHERIKLITDNPLFDLLKENNESALKKIKVVPGNTQELGLGISEEDEKFLISQIQIIYHCASQVNFDIQLKSTILTNVRGARELVNFALKCKSLEVLLHVSTMYSNCDQDVIDEKIYPHSTDWKDMITIAEDESMDRYLETMTLKYIHPFPNTYTFSKKIAEQVFTEMCKDKIPLVICRPSIVVFTASEPVEGWTDNLNGPWSLLLVATKGLIDITRGNINTYLDKVYADNVIKKIIIATWKKALDSDNNKDLTVYNVCSDVLWKIQNYCDLKEMKWELPMENRFAWVESSITNCAYYYYIWFILNNLIPAILADTVLKLTGRRTMLVRYLRKTYIANAHILYFMERTFIFKNNGYKTLENSLLKCDETDFTFQKGIQLGPFEQARICVIGLKKYILNEKWPIAPETFANTKKLRAIYLMFYWLKIVITAYLLFWKWNLPVVIWYKMFNYVEAL